IASSTLRTKLRIFERRALLISVRRALLRVALRAEVVLAMVAAWTALPPIHPSVDRYRGVVREIAKMRAGARPAPPMGVAYSRHPPERQRSRLRPPPIRRPRR